MDSQPNKGRGFYATMAKAIRVHPTHITHVFKGEKELTVEQAQNLGLFLKFKEIELDYLIHLVLLVRAGTEELKLHFEKKLENLKQESQNLGAYIAPEDTLSAQDKFIFYSRWYYAVILQLCSMEDYGSSETICQKLPLAQDIVEEALRFLLEKKIITVDDQGQIKRNHPNIHLESSSEIVWELHKTWRLKSLEHHKRKFEQNIFYSASVSVSKKDAILIKKKIRELIKDIVEIAKETKPEVIMGLGIDWFDVLN